MDDDVGELIVAIEQLLDPENICSSEMLVAGLEGVDVVEESMDIGDGYHIHIEETGLDEWVLDDYDRAFRTAERVANEFGIAVDRHPDGQPKNGYRYVFSLHSLYFGEMEMASMTNPLSANT